MTIKHKCDNEIVENNATIRTENRSSYHENFHSDFSPWHYWTEIYYVVKKCSKCGKSHEIKEDKLI